MRYAFGFEISNLGCFVIVAYNMLEANNVIQRMLSRTPAKFDSHEHRLEFRIIKCVDLGRVLEEYDTF